jgi:hypothetical protein
MPRRAPLGIRPRRPRPELVDKRLGLSERVYHGASIARRAGRPNT